MFTMFASVSVALIVACFFEALFIGRKRLINATAQSSNDELKKALHGNKITAMLHYGFLASLAPLIYAAIKQSANFELMLVLAAFSGVLLAVLDRVLFKQHRTAVQVFVLERQNEELSEFAGRESGIMEWGKSFYPILILVICLRGFLFEPFQIPSSSMLPTLRVGDFLLVNKFTYGLRLPVLGTEVVDFNDPQKGDVIVFKKWRLSQEDLTLGRSSSHSNGYESWIKRVIAGPGDTFKIDYADRLIYVNGLKLSKTFVDRGLDDQARSGQVRLEIHEEMISGVTHQIYNYISRITGDQRAVFKSGITYTVPDNKFFVMGDNRDDSTDGRFVGYIDESDVIGKASVVWMYLGSPVTKKVFEKVDDTIDEDESFKLIKKYYYKTKNYFIEVYYKFLNFFANVFSRNGSIN